MTVPTLRSRPIGAFPWLCRRCVAQISDDLRDYQRRAAGRMSLQRLAEQIRSLCRDVFIDDHRDAETVCRRLGMDPNRYGQAIRILLEKASELSTGSPSPQWDFDAAPGTPLNPEIQQAWGQCDPEAAVEFVVAPTYCVGDRIYAKQQVFTRQRRISMLR